MTDVPNLVGVAVVAPICNSDHSSLSAVLSMAQAVPNLCVSRKVFLKHQVNWNTVSGAIQEPPLRNIWLSDNPVEVLNEHLSLLVGHPIRLVILLGGHLCWSFIQPRSSVCERRISLGLMINTGMLLASSRRLIFGGPVIALGLTGESVSAVK